MQRVRRAGCAEARRHRGDRGGAGGDRARGRTGALRGGAVELCAVRATASGSSRTSHALAARRRTGGAVASGIPRSPRRPRIAMARRPRTWCWRGCGACPRSIVVPLPGPASIENAGTLGRAASSLLAMDVAAARRALRRAARLMRVPRGARRPPAGRRASARRGAGDGHRAAPGKSAPRRRLSSRDGYSPPEPRRGRAAVWAAPLPRWRERLASRAAGASCSMQHVRLSRAVAQRGDPEAGLGAAGVPARCLWLRTSLEDAQRASTSCSGWSRRRHGRLASVRRSCGRRRARRSRGRSRRASLSPAPARAGSAPDSRRKASACGWRRWAFVMRHAARPELRGARGRPSGTTASCARRSRCGSAHARARAGRRGACCAGRRRRPPRAPSRLRSWPRSSVSPGSRRWQRMAAMTHGGEWRPSSRGRTSCSEDRRSRHACRARTATVRPWCWCRKPLPGLWGSCSVERHRLDTAVRVRGPRRERPRSCRALPGFVFRDIDELRACRGRVYEFRTLASISLLPTWLPALEMRNDGHGISYAWRAKGRSSRRPRGGVGLFVALTNLGCWSAYRPGTPQRSSTSHQSPSCRGGPAPLCYWTRGSTTTAMASSTCQGADLDGCREGGVGLTDAAHIVVLNRTLLVLDAQGKGQARLEPAGELFTHADSCRAPCWDANSVRWNPRRPVAFSSCRRSRNAVGRSRCFVIGSARCAPRS